jgi:colanic acid/amylovoran biosynthesis glycosyltransferase
MILGEIFAGNFACGPVLLMSMKIAYLINQYPQVSHSFIRREIAAIEGLGVQVSRFSVRQCQGGIVDHADWQEQQQTRAILAAGAGGILAAVAKVMLTRPVSGVQALMLAIQVGWKSDRGVLRHLIYWAEACLLFLWLQAEPVDHLHAHFGTNSATVGMLCRVLGGPAYSFTVHGPEEFDKALLLALDHKIKHAAFVVAISAYGKSQLYRYCPLSHWSKIHVVRCGVDTQFLAAPPTPLPEQPNLVCVGRLSEQKGHVILLQAAQLLKQAGVKFLLTLVGDGPLRPQLEAQIQDLGLAEHIQITGWADTNRVRQEILAARALVLPSFAEGLPVVLMEALALQRPVITTYVAGIPELVQPGYNGWLVPAGAVSELALAMRAALEATALDLEKLGEQGQQQVAQKHNVDQEARLLVRLFEGKMQHG